MGQPTFEYVPLIGVTGATITALTLSNVSTKHGSRDTDAGRLWGYLSHNDEGDLSLQLFNSPRRGETDLVLKSQSVQPADLAAAGGWLDLDDNRAGGKMTGRVNVSNLLLQPDQTDAEWLAVITFATDRDVAASLQIVEALPGYDAMYGLGEYHAAAMREILTGDLPAAVPHLYAGGVGAAGFIAGAAGAALPDLRQLASIGLLREAQGALVKARAADEQEHLAEFAQLAEAARKRYLDLMAALATANVKDEQAAAAEPDLGGGVTFDTFNRG